MANLHHQEIHFKLNELILFYNFPLILEEVKQTPECHHIENLRCSRANELTPKQCIETRKCELYLNRRKLFTDYGINVRALQELDQELRRKK